MIEFEFMLFRLPDDIWVVDLDSTKLTPPSGGYDEIPPLPEPEGTILKNHLKQVSFINKKNFILFEDGVIQGSGCRFEIRRKTLKCWKYTIFFSCPESLVYSHLTSSTSRK